MHPNPACGLSKDIWVGHCKKRILNHWSIALMLLLPAASGAAVVHWQVRAISVSHISPSVEKVVLALVLVELVEQPSLEPIRVFYHHHPPQAKYRVLVRFQG